MRRVKITKPAASAGVVGVIDGDRFKWPGQHFWVTPIRDDGGDKHLALTYEDCPVEEVPLKINPDGVSAYSYHDCITRGVCQQCCKPLEWKLKIGVNDDRFCYAICCATKYSMLPERVRVMASFAYPMSEEEMGRDSNDDLCDEDFLKELERLK